ncbi:MAG: hypothetical protein C5B50_25405, partial [Verrucomicrobia bacterium]
STLDPRPSTLDPRPSTLDPRPSTLEIWTLAHQPSRIPKGKALRIVTEAPGVVHWSSNAWITAHDQPASETGLNCWYADLPAADVPFGGKILFTFHWQDRWEGRDYGVEII